MPRAHAKPNGAMIAGLRVRHGLTQKELADRAGYAKRTIERLEAGIHAKFDTLKDVAEALEVRVDVLLAEPDVLSDGRMRLELVFQSESDEKIFELLGKLFELLSKLIGDFEVVSVRKGSLIVTLEVTEDQAELLLELAKQGKFTDFGLINPRNIESCSGPITIFEFMRKRIGQPQQVGASPGSDPAGYEPDLAQFRHRLKVLARILVPRKLQARFDSSDVVQDTLAKAHRNLADFKGTSDAEFLAWLKQILHNACIDNVKLHTAAKRDPGMEISLQQSFDESFARLEKLLAADTSSPSEGVKSAELFMKALDVLGTLPSKEREVIICYYLHGLTQQQTAESLEISKGDVAHSIRRGLMKLREEFKDEISE